MNSTDANIKFLRFSFANSYIIVTITDIDNIMCVQVSSF